MNAPQNSSLRSSLDQLVMSVELTLISIIQGIALYFLVENSHPLLVNLQWVYWPYVATGLITIFLFWSRSVIHTLTIIRWPIEFGHNFFYIACTLVEAVTFTQIDQPVRWFVLTGIFSVLIWLLFVWDLRVMRRQFKSNPHFLPAEIYQRVEKDQLTNIYFLVPMTILFNFAAAWMVKQWGHSMFFAGFQLLAALGYLFLVIRFYRGISAQLTGAAGN